MGGGVMGRVSKFLVIGSGIAGLSFALRAAKKGRVTIITKKEASESSTNYAQGGIATVWSDEDTFESHIEDTHKAGAGLCHADTVDLVVRDAPARIRELIEWGVEFTRRTGKREFDLHREGGHSARRIFHAKDLTGREVERALLARARENPRIHIFENHTAINLITRQKLSSFDHPGVDEVLGAYVLDRTTGAIHTFDTMNHFFLIAQMIVPGSSYWNIGIGREIGEVEKDEEGVATMRTLGRNMAWLLKRLTGGEG